MTVDLVVRAMQMDILCSPVFPANHAMNNKVLFIFSISGSVLKLETHFPSFLLYDRIHAVFKIVQERGPFKVTIPWASAMLIRGEFDDILLNQEMSFSPYKTLCQK